MGPGRYSFVLITSTLLGLMLSPPSFGQTDTSKVIRCAKIPDRDQRLSCYDRTVNEMVIEMQTQPIESQVLDSVSDRQTAAIEPTTKAPFWASWGLKKSPSELKQESRELRTELARFVRGNQGTYTFYLSSGQVWRQKYIRTLSSLKVGDIVLLKQNTMGGVEIKVGRNVFVQVSRVR